MSVTDFERKLQENGYLPKDKDELIGALQDASTGMNFVSIELLYKYLR